jgi:hypothetical protein
MKKSVRVALIAVMLMTVAPMSSFAAMGGTNPHPKARNASSVRAVVTAILSVLGI